MVYLFLANGFEEIEALGTVDIMRRAGIDVKTVGIGGKQVCGSHNIKVEADICDKEFEYNSKNIEMLVLPGGIPGTPNLEKSDCVINALDKAFNDGIFIAAVCAAPSIFGHRGFLKGKKACCYPSFESELMGAEVSQDRVVADGNVITSRGAGTVYDFAAKIVEVLKGKEISDKILSSMLCKR